MTQLVVSQLNENYRRFLEHRDSYVEYGLRVGEELTARKAGLDHGEWGGWLIANFEGSERMAQRLMKAYSDCQANPTQVSDFTSLRQISQAFAKPNNEPSTRQIARELKEMRADDAPIDSTAVEELEDPELLRLEDQFGTVVALIAEARALNPVSRLERLSDALNLAQATTRALKSYVEIS